MLDFEITELAHGWLSARVSNGTSSVVAKASYVFDGILEMVQATISLLEGASEGRFSWMDEPGEYRFLFECADEQVRLRILSFYDFAPRNPDENGTLLLAGEQDLKSWGTTVAAEVNRLGRQYGEEGYKARWHHDFPTADLRKLEIAAAR